MLQLVAVPIPGWVPQVMALRRAAAAALLLALSLAAGAAAADPSPVPAADQPCSAWGCPDAWGPKPGNPMCSGWCDNNDLNACCEETGTVPPTPTVTVPRSYIETTAESSLSVVLLDTTTTVGWEELGLAAATAWAGGHGSPPTVRSLKTTASPADRDGSQIPTTENVQTAAPTTQNAQTIAPTTVKPQPLSQNSGLAWLWVLVSITALACCLCICAGILSLSLHKKMTNTRRIHAKRIEERDDKQSEEEFEEGSEEESDPLQVVKDPAFSAIVEPTVPMLTVTPAPVAQPYAMQVPMIQTMQIPRTSFPMMQPYSGTLPMSGMPATGTGLPLSGGNYYG